MRPTTRLGLLALTLGLYLPFLGRSYDLDGGFILLHASNTFAAPLDPYTGHYDNMGWRLDGRMWSHPPFLNYYLAPVAGWLPGLAVPAAHLALLPFLLLFFPALRLLGPLAPDDRGQALLLTSPLLVVLAHSISWEIPTLGCSLLALGLLAEAARRQSLAWIGLCALPVAAALLLAYPAGRVLLPLLLLGRLLRVSWARLALLCLLGVLPIGLFQLWTFLLWGTPHYIQVMHGELATFLYHILLRPWGPSMANLLADLGALPALAPLLVLAPRRPRLAAVALGCGLAVGILAPLHGRLLRAQMALWSALGAFALLLVAARTVELLRLTPDTPADGRRAAILWAAWFWLEVVFCMAGTVYGSARYILPLVPPLAFFLAEEWRRMGLGRRLFAAVLAVNVAAALLLSLADLEEVQAYRDAPGRLATIPPPEPGGRSFYVGEWGFHTAMERAGHEYLHFVDPLRPGDRIVRPSRLAAEMMVLNGHLLDGVEPVLTETVRLPARVPVRLNDPFSQAGFWWSGGGLLPLSFTRGPVDELEVYRIRPLPLLLKAAQELSAPGSEAGPRLVLARFGDWVPRAAIFLHPPAAVALPLPEGASALRLGAGIHPDAGPGDGAEVRAFLEAAGGGPRVELLRLSADRADWREASCRFGPVPAGARLVLETGPGPRGDFSFDWLCVRPLVD
jgi:GNAT superfamily N-acetyltransferase